jgi:hypothetical protein
MERQALESRLARLHALLVDLKFSVLDAEIQRGSVNGHCSGPAVEKTSDSGVIGSEHSSDPLTPVTVKC